MICYLSLPCKNPSSDWQFEADKLVAHGGDGGICVRIQRWHKNSSHECLVALFVFCAPSRHWNSISVEMQIVTSRRCPLTNIWEKLLTRPIGLHKASSMYKDLKNELETLNPCLKWFILSLNRNRFTFCYKLPPNINLQTRLGCIPP